MAVNEKLLKLIKARQEKKTEFNYGILTADRYVKSIQQCVGSDLCYRYATTKGTSFQDVIDKAAKTLVYSNTDMVLENRMGREIAETANGTEWPLAFKGAIPYWTHKEISGEGLDIPAKSLMIFKHVLTTPKKDRDGDILRTQGAAVDPKMLLLWQHVHTLPIGKMLTVAEHTANKLSLISVIVDMNELCHDAATMIEAGMGRFSHGFRALEFEELKEDEGETTSPGGFDIKKFEIMEASLVSVPSNTDAETEEILLDLVEGGKLTSALMKGVGEQVRANRPLAVTFNLTDEQASRLVSETERLGTYSKTTTKFREKEDENQPRDRSSKGEKQKEGCSCPPKEADGEAPAEEKEAGDTEVVAADKRVALSGSWEWTEKILKQKAGAFLAAHAVNLRDRFVWLAGTFADYAVICAESHYSDVPDEYLYYRAEWEVAENEPAWKGTPEEVTIETSVEIRERSPLSTAKQGNYGIEDLFNEWDNKSDPELEELQESVIEIVAKAGRTLSARNLTRLTGVRDDLAELVEKEEMTRAGGALCRGCVKTLDEIIQEAGGNEGEEAVGVLESKEVCVSNAMSVIFARASSLERRDLIKVLKTLERVEEEHQRAEQLGSLVGS